MNDRVFVSKFGSALRIAGDHPELKWASMYLTNGKKLLADLAPAIDASDHAEALWHKAVGNKAPVIADAESVYRRWANTVRADVHGAELGGYLTDYGSVAGLDLALDKLTAGLGARTADTASEKALPYAADAVTELKAKHDALEALILSTGKEWQNFRDAAARKNALKDQAMEVFMAVRRHLKADLPGDSEVKKLEGRGGRSPRSVTQPPATTPTP